LVWFFGWVLVSMWSVVGSITTETRMPVSRASRNPLICYTGYVPATSDLVRLDVCGDPADLIVRFLNTLDVEDGTDALDTLDGWTAWLSGQGLDGCFGPQDPGALEQARALRGDLRALASGGQHPQGRQVDIQVALTADGQVELSAPTAAGFLAAAAAKVAIEQRIDRVKICPADDCRWAFYDTSRNRSRQWCSMEVCGNRAKARAHRRRAATPSVVPA
jgi:hypothetical protein